MAKFRTVLLTPLIGKPLAASLLFFGFFCAIFVPKNDDAAARQAKSDASAPESGAPVGEKSKRENAEDARNGEKKALYSNNDKTRRNAVPTGEEKATPIPEKSGADGPLALGRRAFEQAAEATRTSTFEKTTSEIFAIARVPQETRATSEARVEEERRTEASVGTAPRVVRQNAYSGAVVFYELSNGLRVLLKKTTERRSGIRVVLRDAGTLGERERAGTGLAVLTASLVAENANATLRDVGAARLDWRVGREGAVFSLDVPEEEFASALTATTDALWRSTFDEARFERAVRASRRRVEAAATERATLVENLTAETVYVASPFREPIDGRLDRLTETTLDDVRSFAASRFAPNRTTLAIAGPFDPEDALAAVVSASRGVRRSAPFGSEPPTEPRQTNVRDAFVEAPGTPATLVLAWPTVERREPDAAALDVLAEILTGGANGRLTRKAEDGATPALDVAARSRTPFGVRGFFEIRADVAAENWPVVEATIRAELRRLGEEGPSEAETTAAKKRLATARAARDRNPIAALEARAEALAATGDPDFEARRSAAVERVDASAVGRVVRERFGDVFCRIAVLPRGTAPRLIVPERFEPSPILLTTRTFPNGLRVVAVDAPDERLIDVRFVALAGALVETAETAGRTELLGEMLDKGSKRFSRSEVARFFDSIGSRFEVAVDRNAISFGATVLKEDFDEAFEVLLDAATNPLFDEEEFARAKTRRLAALARRSESVEETLFEIFARSVPPESAFAVPLAGTPESVASTTSDDLRLFWRQIFAPQNLIVGIDGPLEGTTATSAAFARLEAVAPNPDFRPISLDRPNEPAQPIRRYKLARGATVGSALLAAPIPAASERADRAALTVLQAIWEEAFAERFEREFDGEAKARVELPPGPAPSYMIVWWTTEPENLAEASRRVLGTIDATLKSLISEERCRRAKKQILARRKGRYVGLKERTFRLILDEFYRVAPETPPSEREREFEDAILQTTAADVERVARRYWKPDRAIWASVSPIPTPGMIPGSETEGEETTRE